MVCQLLYTLILRMREKESLTLTLNSFYIVWECYSYIYYFKHKYHRGAVYKTTERS